MRPPKYHPKHQCCPDDWRRTPDLTGSYELDAAIARNSNKDIPHRLEYYCSSYGNGASSDNAYAPKTAYRGYKGGDS